MEGYLSKKSGRVKGLHGWHARFFELKEGSRVLRYWLDADSRAKGKAAKELQLLDFAFYQPKAGDDLAKNQYRFVATVSCLTADDGGGAIGLQDRHVDLKALLPASYQVWIPLVLMFHPEHAPSSPSSALLLKVFLPDGEGGYCTLKVGPTTTGLDVKDHALHTMQKRSTKPLSSDEFVLIDKDRPLTNETLVQKLFGGESTVTLTMKRDERMANHALATSPRQSESSTERAPRDSHVLESKVSLPERHESLQAQARVLSSWHQMQTYLLQEQAAEELLEKQLDQEIDRLLNALNLDRRAAEASCFRHDNPTHQTGALDLS